MHRCIHAYMDLHVSVCILIHIHMYIYMYVHMFISHCFLRAAHFCAVSLSAGQTYYYQRACQCNGRPGDPSAPA